MLKLTPLVSTLHSWPPQVAASLEEQAFAEAWGKKAKEVFTDKTLNTLTPTNKKLMEKINKIGVANLALEDREMVCLRPVFSYQEDSVLLNESNALFECCSSTSSV